MVDHLRTFPQLPVVRVVGDSAQFLADGDRIGVHLLDQQTERAARVEAAATSGDREPV